MASKEVVADILTGTAPELSKKFRQLPLANKIIQLEKAIVQPKKSDTPTMLSMVVKQLVETGAIYPDEASAVYSRLLDRLVKFNSLRNHQSLEGLVQDIQQGQRSTIVHQLKDVKAMSNMVVLQNFFAGLPKTVGSGQQNYVAFQSLLKQFVIDYNPFLELYRSGPDTFLQYNFGPAVQKVNLSQAFDNLSKIWGLKVTNEKDIPSLTALLQPQTRYLLLLLSPIAIEQYFTPDSFVWYLFKLYKNTVAPPMSGEPVEELGNIIASLGPSYDQLKLTQGLNYLVTNQQREYQPAISDLSKEEEALLRYVQTLLKTKIVNMRRTLKQSDLDNVIQNLNPTVFQGQLAFLNKLFDFFSKILQINPEYLTQIIFDAEWKPPSVFFLKSVLTPQDLAHVPPPKPIPDTVFSAPPVPVPRTVFLAPRLVHKPRRMSDRRPYRIVEPVITTDTDTESDLEPLSPVPPPVPAPRQRPPVTVDVDNLSAVFSKLKGQGIDAHILRDFRQKVRNVNVRPY
ncbi:MAG: pre-hexon-linking protein IIIa [psittacine adenovirus 7]|uniref:Pre-hexon-linking protein IIIa n=1 Tax=psittacine adenovirus 7 TaxID=2848040 RepID=A0A6B9LU68_9ADEN|nr:MAG: pre-hexon-linking protein IIIa [psittacine adenovirus 7]QHB43555.1 MAG: pre-hexon-linking protein IIIa [psittacine adenovirus 7]